MVQVSTDYVFAGDATTPYPVEAPVAPRNAYGRGKAAGEWAVRAECPASYVVRTSWLYCAYGHCFPRTAPPGGRAGHRRGSRRSARSAHLDWDLSIFVLELVTSSAPFGTNHGRARGSTTWFGLARAIFEGAGLDPARVRPTNSTRHPRPAYSVLENGDRMPAWDDALHRALPGLLDGKCQP